MGPRLVYSFSAAKLGYYREIPKHFITKILKRFKLTPIKKMYTPFHNAVYI